MRKASPLIPSAKHRSYRFESVVPLYDDSYLRFLRSQPERLKPGELVIAIDFDWTITSPDDPDSFYQIPRLRDHADTAIRSLHDMGWDIVIYSARFSHERFSEKQRWRSQRHVETVFRYYQIPFTRIWLHPGKPMATWYLDDRSLPPFPGFEPVLQFLTLYMELAEGIFATMGAAISYRQAMGERRERKAGGVR